MTILHSMHSNFGNSNDERKKNSSDPFQITIVPGKLTTFKAFSIIPCQYGQMEDLCIMNFAQTFEELN